MDKKRLADLRSPMQCAVDLLDQLTTGHQLRLVHGVSTREIIYIKNELQEQINRLDELENDLKNDKEIKHEN